MHRKNLKFLGDRPKMGFCRDTIFCASGSSCRQHPETQDVASLQWAKFFASSDTLQGSTQNIGRTFLAPLFFFVFFLVFPVKGTASEMSDFELTSSVIHLDTFIAGGNLTPEEMVQKVREAGIKVAIVTDKDNNKLEYGLFPLRNLIKKTVERESILHYGAQKSLDYIKKVQDENPDMLVLHGTETIPSYYWEGNILSGLKVVNFHKNLIILGMKNAEDYEGLPSVASKQPREISLDALPLAMFNLWPLFLIIPAFYGYRYRTRFVKFTEDKIIDEYKMPLRRFSIGILVCALILVINNFPYFPPKYDQYHGSNDVDPFQDQIDYANERGALSFWASPDIETSHHKIGPVVLETPPYYEDLLYTEDYTGFAVFNEGMKYTGIPDGVWDKVLREYLKGERDKPIWAIGEIDFEDGSGVSESQTMLLLKEFTEEDVLKALAEGRYYAVTGNPQLKKPTLRSFELWDDDKEEWKTMGENAKVQIGAITKIKMKIDIPDDYPKENSLKIIREGEIIKEFDNIEGEFSGLVEINFSKLPKQKTYYRLDFNSKLIANPIFVKFYD